MTRYRCIMADPPWFESGGGKIKRGADRHYPLMRHPEILALLRSVLEDKIDSSCHLWLWATDNHFLEAVYVMQSLGFRFVRTLCWVKMQNGKLQIGLGQYLRGSHESCLFGVRGETAKPSTDQRQSSVVIAPRGRHSQKPDEAIQVIEKTSPGPRFELFARNRRPGWDAWGNEVPRE